MKWLTQFWSVTEFACKEQTNYAVEMMVSETKKGVITMSAVSVLLYAIASVIYAYLEMPESYLYTHGLLMVLSIHIAFSARASIDIRALYLLAMTLLIVGSVAIVLLAHHTGSFSVGIFGFMVLLFTIIPLVPWGLREAGAVIALIYAVFTLSTISVTGRFDAQTLLLLQFLMLGAGITSISIVARNLLVRKDDIQVRYELERAHREQELLSLRDHLTGAWNRRFLENNFASIASAYREQDQCLYFAVLDVDYFKQLNDEYGHDFGDIVLEKMAQYFIAHLNETSYLIRLGGDEFAILTSDVHPGVLIQQGIDALHNDVEITRFCPAIQVSSGIVSVTPQQRAFLEEIYKQADKALYQAKHERKDATGQSQSVTCALSESILP